MFIQQQIVCLDCNTEKDQEGYKLNKINIYYLENFRQGGQTFSKHKTMLAHFLLVYFV